MLVILADQCLRWAAWAAEPETEITFLSQLLTPQLWAGRQTRHSRALQQCVLYVYAWHQLKYRWVQLEILDRAVAPALAQWVTQPPLPASATHTWP